MTDLPRLAASLKRQVSELARIAQRHVSGAERYGAIRKDLLDLWLGLAHQHGVPLTDAQIEQLLQSDLDLDAQGLMVWADRQQRS